MVFTPQGSTSVTFWQQKVGGKEAFSSLKLSKFDSKTKKDTIQKVTFYSENMTTKNQKTDDMSTEISLELDIDDINYLEEKAKQQNKSLDVLLNEIFKEYFNEQKNIIK